MLSRNFLLKQLLVYAWIYFMQCLNACEVNHHSSLGTIYIFFKWLQKLSYSTRLCEFCWYLPTSYHSFIHFTINKRSIRDKRGNIAISLRIISTGETPKILQLLKCNSRSNQWHFYHTMFVVHKTSKRSKSPVEVNAKVQPEHTKLQWIAK